MNYITTPIYYVNDKPHIGHAVTTLAADVLARYWRLQKQETFFLTGTDEHGAKIAQAAEVAGVEPHAFTDSIAQEFQSAWQSLAIEPDGFIRTTDPKHEAVVKHFLQGLYDQGNIYKGEYKGWYCTGCEEFKTETQLGSNNTCPIHLKPVSEITEETYLFKLSNFKDQIVNAIQSDQLKIRPETRKNEVLGFLKEDLRDVAISRKNVAWGIGLPWDESHTVYVWVDALLNYISATDLNGPEFDSGKRPQFLPTLQLIGKDILRFHAIIWPGLLLAAGKPLPKELFVHGYFTVDGQKMSKSLGNVISPQQLVDRYGVDGARYLLLASVPFGSDGDISFDRLDALYTSDLANNLGNFVNRVQAMLVRYKQGKITHSTDLLEVDIREHVHIYEEKLKVNDLSGALEEVINIGRKYNTYIEENKPWELAKHRDAKLELVLATLAEACFCIGGLLAPFLPQTSAKILSIFGASVDEVDYATLGKEQSTAGKIIQPIEPLFPRLIA